MNEPKICPLLSIGVAFENLNCHKERCAWWDPMSKECCIASTAYYIWEAADQLERPADVEDPQ